MKSRKGGKERSKNNRKKDVDWPCGGTKNYIEREKE